MGFRVICKLRPSRVSGEVLQVLKFPALVVWRTVVSDTEYLLASALGGTHGFRV